VAENDLSSALCSPGPTQTATTALLEVGVKTGLSLVLTLLQQSWQSGTSGGSLGNSVLGVAHSLLMALPPLSLANETQLNRLAVDSLQQVTKFLLEASLPQGGADSEGNFPQFMVLHTLQGHVFVLVVLSF